MTAPRTPRQVPADESRGWYATLTHPVCLVAAVVLVINDHYLKQQHPSWLTGKLSDLAFMILAPLWLYAAWLGWQSLEHRRSLRRERERALLSAIALVATTFVLMQLTTWGDAMFRWGLGTLQYPAYLVWGLVNDGSVVSLNPVRATMDPTDLFCLPMLVLTWHCGARSLRDGPERQSCGPTSA